MYAHLTHNTVKHTQSHKGIHQYMRISFVQSLYNLMQQSTRLMLVTAPTLNQTHN